MQTIPGSECAAALVAVGLADLCIVRALMSEVGLSHDEAVLATGEARRTNAVHTVDAEVERELRRRAVAQRWVAPTRPKVMA